LQLAEALDAEQAGHRATRQRLDASRARVEGLQREAGKLREGVRTLVGKSDVDDKLVAQLRGERLELQQKLAGERRLASDAGSPTRTVYAGGRGNAATSVAGMSAAQLGIASGDQGEPGFGGGGEFSSHAGSPGAASSMSSAGGAGGRRMAAEAARVSRLAEGQARRLEAQDAMIRDLKQQLSAAKRRNKGSSAASDRTSDTASLPAASGSRPPSTGGSMAPSAGTGGGSAGVRAMAVLEVRAGEAERAAATASEELESVRDAMGRSEARCRVLERQTDQYVAKFSVLERRCRELEARTGAAAPATDAVSMAAQLATSENERRALRSNMTAALAARDAEIARLRERCESLLAHVTAQAGKVAEVAKAEDSPTATEEVDQLRSGNAVLRQEVASLRRRLQSMQ
jgi:hypothetical protein